MKQFLSLAILTISLISSAEANYKNGTNVTCTGYVTKNDKLFEVNSNKFYSFEEISKGYGYVFVDTDWKSEMHLYMGGYIHPATVNGNVENVGQGVTMTLDMGTTSAAKGSMTRPTFRVAQVYTEVSSQKFSLRGEWSSLDERESFIVDDAEVRIKYDVTCTLNKI